MKLKETVSWIMGTLQRHLFPRLEECWERSLTDKEQQLVSILELIQIEKFVGQPRPKRCGRKVCERRAMARAFVGKAVYNHPTTRATLEALSASPIFRRICGFVRSGDIPSEATFSRAFAEFAEKGLGDRVHEAMVERCVKPELVGHISRDATAIRGREKPVVKPPVEKPAPRKKGRPRRGEVREPKAETRWSVNAGKLPPRLWRNCWCTVMLGRRGILKGIRRVGEVTSCTPTSMTAACPSAWN